MRQFATRKEIDERVSERKSSAALDLHGWFLAQVPEVPEAISQGRSVEEARVNVQEALSAALEWWAAEGEELAEAQRGDREPGHGQPTLTPGA